VTRHRSCAWSTRRIIWRPPWGRIKGDSQPQFEFVEVLVFSVRLLAVTVGFLEFSPFVWSFFELLSLLRKDEDNAILFSRTVNRRGSCVYDAGDGDDENCSVRLTWDVFVRHLTRLLGTPSHWLPVDSCKEGQKGALAAVCTPTLKSASKKHQKLCTSVSEHREGYSEGG